MSTSLKSYPASMWLMIAHRRDAAGTGGLGYWGARDAIKKHDTKVPKEKTNE